jgi:hypothetical protein
LGEQFRTVFRGGFRWISAGVVLGAVAVIVLMVLAAISFFRADGVREMIAWATAFLFGMLVLATSRIWLMIAMHHYVVLGELKRLKQLVVLLASQPAPRT